MGSALNLTGSANPAWSTMRAQVQQISYDILAGRTVVRCGPAAHLGAKDIVELNRANRGPRPYYLIGGNMANAANASSGPNPSATNVAQRAHSSGTEQNSVAITHQNLADSQANTYANGWPGFTVDTRSTGQPAYLSNAGLSSPTKTTLAIIDGGSGSYGAGIRLSLSDATNGTYHGTFYLREVPICYDFGAGPVSAFIMGLFSAPYATSISSGGGPSPG